MAVLPSVTPPHVGPDGPANILFFGAFGQMEEEAFIEKRLGSLTDNRAVFETFAFRSVFQCSSRSISGGHL